MWANDVVLRLIDVYKNFELLWDPNHNSYKDRKKKNDAWEEIGRIMNLPRRDVELKVHSLRSQFVRERKKTKMSATGDVVRQSAWFAYKSLMFLAKSESSSFTDSISKQDIYQDSQSTNDSEISNFILDNPNPEIESIHIEDYTEPRSQIYRKRRHEDNSYDFTDSDKLTDDFDVYGHYIASELRQVKSEHTVIMAKYLINNIILDARLGKLNMAIPSVSNTHLSNAISSSMVNSGSSGSKTQNDLDDVVVKYESDDI